MTSRPRSTGHVAAGRVAGRVGRRTAIATTLLSATALPACNVDPSTSEQTPEQTAGPDGRTDQVDQTADGDETTLAGVVVEIERAEAVLAAATAAVPRLGVRLAPLLAAHAAHRETLTPDDTGSPSPEPTGATPPSMGSAKAAMREVRRSERRVQQAALAACVEVDSGDLARALASLAASTSQHCAELEGTR